MLTYDQEFLDAWPAGVIVTDNGLMVRQINRWLLERLPGARSAYLGRTLGDAFPELADRSLLAAYDLVMEQREALRLPMNIHRYWLRLPAAAGSELAEMPQSAHLIPLWADGQLAGILTVVEDETERRRTELQLQREIDTLTALHDIDRALATLDLQACLQIIVSRTRALFRGENAALLLCDGGRLTVAAEAGYEASVVGQTIGLEAGVTGWVVREQASALVPDVTRDARYLAIDPRARSEMAAPLMLRDDCLGVINVESRRPAAFGEPDLEILEALAGRAAAAIHNARLHAAANEQRQLADSLRDIALSLSQELNPNAILDVLLDQVRAVLPYDSACVMQLDPQTQRLRMVRHRGYEQFGVAAAVAAFDHPLETIPNLARMATSLRPAVVTDVRADPEWIAGDLAAHIGSWAGAPIVARGQLLGILSLDKQQTGFYAPALAERLAALAAAAGLAWENARLFAEQERLAMTDGLTGVANRRQFDLVLARELNRAERYGRPLAVIIVDIDDFKAYNDTFGHPAGDDALRVLAALLSRSIRAMDTAARYGGEEFAIILPEIALPEAVCVAERLQSAISQLALPGAGPGAGVTISAGVAAAPEHGQTPAVLVQTADAALYQAKHRGKNNVVAAG